MIVQYAEMQGYPIGKWSGGDFDGYRRLKVAWDSIYNLLSSLENTAWPYATGPSACTPISATVKPFPGCRQHGSGNKASYDWAMVDMRYTTRGPTWKKSLGYSVHETTSPFTQVKQIDPDGKLFWNNNDTNPLTTREGPIAQWHGMKFSLTFSGLRTAPSGAWDYLKYVNSNAVTSYTLGRTFAAGTLLYKGAVIGANYAWGRMPRYSVTYEFIYWPPGHNTIFRQESAGFVPVYHAGGAAFELYPQTTFNV